MIVKYFGIIIDHTRKIIIHGESGAIYTVENIYGCLATIYKTVHGYESELERAKRSYPAYSVLTAGSALAFFYK